MLAMEERRDYFGGLCVVSHIFMLVFNSVVVPWCRIQSFVLCFP